MRRSIREGVWWLLLLAAPLGCGGRPRAPALEDKSVYSNTGEKIRFLVPDGWLQQAKSNLPPGPVERERALVIYRYPESDAEMELSVLDMEDEPDILEYLTSKKRSGARWQSKAEAEKIELASGPATRYLLEATVRGQRLIREVVVFRRGKRVYFINGLYRPADTLRRGELRQAVESLRWNP